MYSGTVKFYMDDVECPNTIGVGAIFGGVFNCGLRGSTFEARCTETCSPYFAVQEVKLWKAEALNVVGTPYVFAGN